MNAIDNAKLLVFEAERQEVIDATYAKETLAFLETANLDNPEDVCKVQEILESVHEKSNEGKDTSKEDLSDQIMEASSAGEISEEEKDLLMSLL